MPVIRPLNETIAQLRHLISHQRRANILISVDDESLFSSLRHFSFLAATACNHHREADTLDREEEETSR